jgi:hypothetical protein
MKKYLYDFFHALSLHDEDITVALCERGQDGWRVIHAQLVASTWVFLLEREAEGGEPAEIGL